MKALRRPGFSSGFTLIEVLMAMTIFGVGILGVVTSLSLATRSSGSANRLAEAARLADRHIARAVVAGAEALGNDSGAEGAYRWRKTYESKTDDLVLATITVEWEDRGETQEYVLNQLFLPPQQE